MNQSEHHQTTMTRTETTAPVDELISSLCATIPGYPKPGIVF